jgi:hypothetical protein
VRKTAPQVGIGPEKRHLYTDEMSPTSTTSPIVLYQNSNFTGRALLIRWVPAQEGDNPIGWAGYLGYQNMNDSVASVRTYAGGWCLFADAWQTGTMACLGPNGWYKNNGEIGLTGISSLGFAGAGWAFP